MDARRAGHAAGLRALPELERRGGRAFERQGLVFVQLRRRSVVLSTVETRGNPSAPRAITPVITINTDCDNQLQSLIDGCCGRGSRCCHRDFTKKERRSAEDAVS